MDDRELAIRQVTFLRKVSSLGCSITLLSTYKGSKEPVEVHFNECGHTHKTSPYYLLNRLKGRCPKCGDPRRKSHETFQKELSLVNQGITLVGTYVSALTKLEYVYNTCGHTHFATPSNLLGGMGLSCPICNNYGNKVLDTFTEQVKEVHPSITLVSKYLGSDKNITIKYSCGHTKTLRANALLHTSLGVCRKCIPMNSKSIVQIQEEFAKYPSIELLGEYVHSKEKVLIKYKDCGHTHEVRPNDLQSGHCNTCPTCGFHGTSKGEKAVLDYIKSLYDGWVEENDRKILGGKELDIVLPDAGVAIEFNGTYWHSDEKKSSTYHQEKTNGVEAFGYQLIHILEWEWENLQDIIKSRLAGLLGKNERLFARKLQVRQVSFAETEAFLNKNHIQGAGAPTSIRYGLYQGEELVAIMTFGTPKMMATIEYELVRYCSKLGTNVVGGASKLLSAFVKEYKPKSLMSYAARDWSTGGLYRKLGFEQIGTTVPGYAYYKGNERVSRHKFQKAKLEEALPEVWDASKTERQMTEEAGYTRVYNSGNLTFVKYYA